MSKHFLWIVLFTLLLGSVPITAAQEPQPYLVQLGDSWTALAWRFQTTITELQALNPHLNQQRQPTIGDTIQRPLAEERLGRLIRPTGEPLLFTAMQQGVSPWQLTLENGKRSPYRPLFGEALFITEGDQPPRDFPPYFGHLELSAVPAYPGEGLAMRGTLTAVWPAEAQLTLGSASGHLIPNSNNQRVVGLIGTGAFFQPGAPELTITYANQRLWSQPWRIAADKPWTFNQITLTGTAAEISQEQIAAERARLFELWKVVTPTPQWQSTFREPIDSYLTYSSFYGARRSYDGGPYSTYHEGLDFAAYGGTEVYAPAGGTVIVAEELYVRGGAVIIDHGLGIYSGVYHLSEVLTTAGETVTAGQLVGKVGSTGFSTGNHLHWDLLVGGVWVDPMAWRVNDTGCWVLAGWGTPCEP